MLDIGSDRTSFDRRGFLDAILETLPEAVAVILPDHRLAELNAAGLSLLDIESLNDIPPGSPLLLLDPNHAPKFKAHFGKVMSGDTLGKIESLFLVVHALDGERRAIECKLAPLKRDDGQLAGVIVTARDVSQRENNLQKVSESAALLSAILQTVPDPMIVIDEDGWITSFSKTAETLFGYLEDEVLGRSIEMVMPEPYRGAHHSYIKRYLQTGEKRIIGIGRILEGQKKDGSLFPMELVVGEIQVGEHRAFTVFIRDLTEKFEAEAKMHELQAELAHTSRLSAVGTLASALAHELNQPLTIIANYLATSRDLLDDWKPEMLETIREAIDESGKAALRAGQIVRRLRDFVSKGEIDRQILPLGKLIHDATTLGLVGAREKGISLSVEIEPHIDNVIADRVQIQQVIVNLMRNAVEAMEHSAIKHLAIRAKRCGSDYAEISVADTGHGVPEVMQGHLFQPFVSTKAKGMGLGLSICHTIIAAHGGEMSVEFEQGGGTIFKFTVPLVSEEMQDES